MDTNETLGARIKRYRKQAGLKQRELAEACGWESQSRVGNYETDFRAPSLSDLKLMARAMGISLSELASTSDIPQSDDAIGSAKDPALAEIHGTYRKTVSKLQQVENIALARQGVVPVVGQAKLGVNGFFEALEFPVGHGDGYLLIRSDDKNAYGLRVIGDSMHPRIKNGEYVLVEPNKPFHSGDEVLVKTTDGQSMIKEFIFLRDGVYRFDSVNQDHPPIHIDQDQIEKIHLVGGILKSSRFTHD